MGTHVARRACVQLDFKPIASTPKLSLHQVLGHRVANLNLRRLRPGDCLWEPAAVLERHTKRDVLLPAFAGLVQQMDRRPS